MGSFSNTLAIGAAVPLLALLAHNLAGAIPVSDAELAQPAGEEWLHGNGSYDGIRFSTLNQIHAGNAGQLKVKWMSALGGKTDAQATPIFHDGRLFIPQDNMLHAFDASTGRLLWRYDTDLPEDWGGQFANLFTGKHRMAAIAGNTVFFVSNECAIHAVEYQTGLRRYRFKIDRPYPRDFNKSPDANGYVCVAGPLAIAGGKLIVPLNGTDTGGLQGYVQGHSQQDGSQLWATNLIPGPGEPGGDSWPGDSRLHGGAGPWIVGSWDADLRTYYTGTANAYPWSPYAERSGRGAGNSRNEGAASVVAVDTDTGKVRWRYSVVPGDPWDYDTPQTPMLFTIDGRRTVIQPNKTCFIHYLDARDGTFLQAPRFCDKITWADGYDRKGEPIWSQPVPKEGETIELWPSMLGGVNLYPSAINPRTGMLYLAAQEVGIAWSYEKIQVTSNVQSLGVSYEILSGGREVDKAVDLRTGAEIWRHDANKAGYAGGMLTTAGGLAIWATQGGELTVADATNGKVLWQLNANTTAKSGPITYMVDGQQQITFALGGSGGFGSVADDWKNTNHGSMVITLGR